VQRENDENEQPPSKRSKTTTRQNVAGILGLTAVTGRSIAYIATQVQTTFTSADCTDLLLRRFVFPCPTLTVGRSLTVTSVHRTSTTTLSTTLRSRQDQGHSNESTNSYDGGQCTSVFNSKWYLIDQNHYSEVFGRRQPAARAPTHVATVTRLMQQRLAREEVHNA
jgi:hypothetical protein